ncbi:MAG TPA: hypothetical protein VEM36_09840 [Xanthobacteraceae bacterium]|nr:hypothetical protein [Xanthobacteraceae bacterium]
MQLPPLERARKNFPAGVIENPHGPRADEVDAGQNGPGLLLRRPGAGLMVDDPGEDFRFVLRSRRADDIDEKDHGSDICAVDSSVNAVPSSWVRKRSGDGSRAVFLGEKIVIEPDSPPGTSADGTR